MAKTIADIEELLGLTGDETIEELLQKYQDYATVTDTEISNIKNISVHTLPTVVRNQEQLVKGRMTNPSINDSQGIPAVLNKRTVLLNLIINKMSSLVNEIKDKVDDVSEGANKVEQSQTNGNIKIDGVEKVVYTLPKATENVLGGVKKGTGISVDENGIISVNKQELNLDEVNNVVVNNKVDKTNNPNLLYGTDSNGQTFYPISQNVEGNKVVQRINNGEISVPLTPTNNNSATSKKYVDDLTSDISNKQNQTLEQSVSVGNTSYTNVEQLLSALGIFVNSLSDEIAQLEGTDTSFSETVTALQTSVNNLQTAWTEFMTGTSADNIINTLTEIRNEIIALQTIISSVDIEDDETEYTKDIPSSAKGLATLTKLGGMSYKSENLLNLTDVVGTYNGITYSVENGVITLNGIATDIVYIYLNITSIASGYYSLCYFNLPSSVYVWWGLSNGSFYSAGGTLTTENLSYSNINFTGDITSFRIRVDSGISLTNYKIKPMLVSGATAPTEYKPYFEGIRDSAVTSVVSKSANLIDISKITDDRYVKQSDGTLDYYTNVCATDYISVEVGKSYYFSGMTTLNSGNTGAMYDSNKNYVGAIATDNDIRPLLIPSGVAYIRLSIWKNKWADYTKAMLNKGTTALPYEPYEVSTYPIASEIQAFTSYSWGINADCYNYIDFESKKFVQKVGRVDLGSLNYTKYEVTEGNLYRASLPSNSIYNTQNCLCAKYEVVTRTTRLNKKYYINNESGGATSNIGTLVDIIDNDYSTASDFKQAMSGVYLYYELATPVETDISSYLGDKHIPIEANGSLTFTNTYNQAVPSSITYDCGLVEVVKTNHEHDLEQQKDIDNLKENKQDKIDSSHKLNADLVDDTSTTHKFVTEAEKTTWNGKQDKIDSSHKLSATNIQGLLKIKAVWLSEVLSVYDSDEITYEQFNDWLLDLLGSSTLIGAGYNQNDMNIEYNISISKEYGVGWKIGWLTIGSQQELEERINDFDYFWLEFLEVQD